MPIRISYQSALSPRFVYIGISLFILVIPDITFFLAKSFRQEFESSDILALSIISLVGCLLFILCLRFFPRTYTISYDDDFVYIVGKSKNKEFLLECVNKIRTTFWGFKVLFTVTDLLILEIRYNGEVIKRGFLSQPNSYFNSSIEKIPLLKEFKRAVIRKKRGLEKNNDLLLMRFEEDKPRAAVATKKRRDTENISPHTYSCKTP